MESPPPKEKGGDAGIGGMRLACADFLALMMRRPALEPPFTLPKERPKAATVAGAIGVRGAAGAPKGTAGAATVRGLARSLKETRYCGNAWHIVW